MMALLNGCLSIGSFVGVWTCLQPLQLLARPLLRPPQLLALIFCFPNGEAHEVEKDIVAKLSSQDFVSSVGRTCGYAQGVFWTILSLF